MKKSKSHICTLYYILTLLPERLNRFKKILGSLLAWFEKLKNIKTRAFLGRILYGRDYQWHPQYSSWQGCAKCSKFFFWPEFILKGVVFRYKLFPIRDLAFFHSFLHSTILLAHLSICLALSNDSISWGHSPYIIKARQSTLLCGICRYEVGILTTRTTSISGATVHGEVLWIK